jgi:hypothetical protein
MRMSKRFVQWILLAGVIFCLDGRFLFAQSNPGGSPEPTPCDPQYGSWFCVQQGTLAPGYGLTPTNVYVNVGQAILPPTVYGLAMTNGLQAHWVTYPCNDNTNHFETNAIPYTFGNVYFVPAIPNVLWTPGSYAYTAMVNAAGSPCAPVTNTIGTFTVTVGTNSPDVLIDIDFGGNAVSAKAGYAAIGDSAHDFWNAYAATGVVSGALANLKTAEGLVSPVGLLVTNLPWVGTNGSADPMYGDYLGTNSGAATVTVTNLPAGFWNIFLYANDGNFQLTVGSSNYSAQVCHDMSPANPLVTWQAGVQYVVFTNVLVTNGQPVTVGINPGTNGVAMISGLQIASVMHTPPTSALVPSGIGAWWKAENNALDSIGTNNGTLQGTVGYAAGEVGQAFLFNNATNDAVTAPASPSLNVGTNVGLTLEAWINPTNVSNPNQWLMGWKANSTTFGSMLKLSQTFASSGIGCLFGNLVDTSNNSHLISSAAGLLTSNVFQHIALTYDKSSGMATLYRNGVVVATQNLGSFTPQTTYAFVMGQRVNSGAGENGYSGLMDEVSIYSRALSSNEIAAIYNAGSLGKINSVTQDSDYDGVSDIQELAYRTNPNDANSVPQIRLGYWPFDNTNTWAGSTGQLPLVATNLVGVPSWNTNAVLIDSNNPAVLAYRDVETNGNANINLRNGTVRFWFKPDWSSVDQGGTGPQAEGRLLEMGTQGSTNGWWGLVVGSSGTNIYFGTQTNSTGTLTTNLSTAISWSSNVWHQVVLTYGATNASLYLDGQPVVTNGMGVAYYPGLAVRANGFEIGSSPSGTNQVRGVFDELETFNYSLSLECINTNYTNLSVILGPPVITSQPQNQAIEVGKTATFNVQVSSSLPVTYQWRIGGNPIAGATGGTLVISSAAVANAGSYDVVVANSAGQANSSPAGLLTFSESYQNSTHIQITVAGLTSADAYDVYVQPLNLSVGLLVPPNGAYRVCCFGSPGQSTFNFPWPTPNQPFTGGAFFAIGSAHDDDGDGITSGYERVVSGSRTDLSDTTGGGMPDGWKAMCGLDPTSNTGNNAATADPDGDNISNLNEYNNGTDPYRSSVNPRPVVTIAANNPTVILGADATFLVTRTGSTVANLTVNYTVGGTATYNTDYQLTPSAGSYYPFSITIPAGSSTAAITVHALNSQSTPQSIILGLVPISIADNSSPATWAYVVDPFKDRATGTVNSSATLTLNDVTLTYGNDATFSAQVTGIAAPHYQWQKIVGSTAPQNVGADSSSYTVVKPSVADSGTKYVVLITSGTTSVTSRQATLTVNPATLTITASTKSKVYGTALTLNGATDFTSVGLQNSDTIGSVSLVSSGSGATAAVGGYTITPSAAIGGTFAAVNYSITYNTGSLMVSAAALTITANNQSKTYGQAVTFGSGSAQFTSSGLQNGETIGTVTLTCSGGVVSAAVSGSPYTITPSVAAGGTFVAGNYIITYSTGTLTVNKANLTITANNTTMGYGQTMPTLTYALNGFVNGENSSVVGGAPNLSTTASSPPGTYPITITQGTLSAANYTFTFQNGTLTIQSVVSITVTQPKASEIGLVPATFAVTRTDTGAALLVNYTFVGGTPGTDYQTPSGSVTIAAGALTSPPILITPLANGNPGVGSKTVVLSLSSSGNYVVGNAPNNSATCTIIDAYGDTDGDGLADAMEALFSGNPPPYSGWKTDADGDGVPDAIDSSPNTADLAPGLPAYTMCPL